MGWVRVLLRVLAAWWRCQTTSFRSPKERRVAWRLWAADPAWKYDVEIALGPGERVRADFVHPHRQIAVEVRSSGESAKWTLARCLALQCAGYTVHIVTDAREVEGII